MMMMMIMMIMIMMMLIGVPLFKIVPLPLKGSSHFKTFNFDELFNTLLVLQMGKNVNYEAPVFFYPETSEILELPKQKLIHHLLKIRDLQNFLI